MDKIYSGECTCYAICEDTEDFPEHPLPVGFLYTYRFLDTLEIVGATTISPVADIDWGQMIGGIEKSATTSGVKGVQLGTAVARVAQVMMGLGYKPVKTIYRKELT